MPLIRFDIQLAIPEDIYNSIPAAKKTAARDAIRGLKALAVKINAGLPNEEMTVKAVWHRCHHDTGESCEAEQEI
jgi:hypothetical protein